MFILRKVLAWGIALGVILWIVLSYLPRETVMLPAIGFPGAWDARFGFGALAALLVFVGVQVTLLWRVRLLRRSAYPGIRYGTELFWTALPLAMTVALAVAGYMVLAR